MIPQYHHNELVEVKGVIGRIRTRSYGWDARNIKPEYGILPEGQISLRFMITANEDEVKRINNNEGN